MAPMISFHDHLFKCIVDRLSLWFSLTRFPMEIHVLYNFGGRLVNVGFHEEHMHTGIEELDRCEPEVVCLE